MAEFFLDFTGQAAQMMKKGIALSRKICYNIKYSIGKALQAAEKERSIFACEANCQIIWKF